MAALLTIEPEVRAQIWDHVLFSDQPVAAPAPGRFVIFFVSKKISAEAQDVFYAFTEFILPLEFHREYFDAGLPPWHAISRMKNVTLSVNGISGPQEFGGSTMESYQSNINYHCRATIDLLTESQTPRNNCRIVFVERCFNMTRMLNGPFFSRLKTLTNFKKVAIEFVMPTPAREDDETRIAPAILGMRDRERVQAEGNLVALRALLEPALGTATIVTDNVSELDMLRCLIFYPRTQTSTT